MIHPLAVAMAIFSSRSLMASDMIELRVQKLFRVEAFRWMFLQQKTAAASRLGLEICVLPQRIGKGACNVA
jgi:hypothetical protein